MSVPPAGPALQRPPGSSACRGQRRGRPRHRSRIRPAGSGQGRISHKPPLAPIHPTGGRPGAAPPVVVDLEKPSDLGFLLMIIIAINSALAISNYWLVRGASFEIAVSMLGGQGADFKCRRR